VENNIDVKLFYENSYNEEAREARDTLEFVRSKIIISRYLSDKTMEIADVGAGPGAYSFWLAKMGHRVHLLDLAQKHIDIAKQKSQINNISLASYSCADARNLPYDDESMDLVLLMGALYHLQSRESRLKCLTEAFRVLKHGGYMLCTVISRYTSLIASLKYDLIDIWVIEYLKKVVNTGILDKSTLPLAYCHTPKEIFSEVSDADFKNIQLIAVEGIGNALGDNSLLKDERTTEHLFKCIELTESIPELLGVSRNIMAIGRKP